MPISMATYEFIFWAWVAIAVLIFFLLLKIAAPYGRHSSSNWGPLIDNHYGWMSMEIPALAMMLVFFIINFTRQDIIIEIIIGIFCLHYFNRTFIYPFRLNTSGKKIPLLIVISGLFFNICNTFLLGYYLTYFASYTLGWLTDIRFILGIILFFGGFWINWKSDTILIKLRGPKETGYKIPQGGLFNLISCPNFFGEIIEWTGYAVLCWNLPAVAFLIWTTANLVPRALAHHKWYKKNFEDYPTQRKAIFPFIL